MMGYRNVIGKMSGMLLFRTSYVLSLLVLMLLMPFTAGSSRAADGDEALHQAGTWNFL